MPDDPPPAALAEIRNRRALAYASPARMAESAADVPRLLAAMEKLLKAADRWQLYAAEGDAADECAGDVRRIITRELTREATDG
jgi:hypothetical protein